ncbi:hypothetical protein ACFRAO_31840 [Streptomyces sp. NPDC056656]|uniref:hypothetical protein n=1 Tax=Streptomyces sp. NPDC056656 TaxID=3345895 RepID=UPI003684D153
MVSLLLVVLGLLVFVLHAAYAVGDSHATRDGGPQATRELWRRARRRFPAAVVLNALTALAVGAMEVAGLVLWSLVDRGAVPGVEPTPLYETATPQYTLVGWVPPIAVWCLGTLLYIVGGHRRDGAGTPFPIHGVVPLLIPGVVPLLRADAPRAMAHPGVGALVTVSRRARLLAGPVRGSPENGGDRSPYGAVAGDGSGREARAARLLAGTGLASCSRRA